MDLNIILGYIGALFVGITLGLIGSGGSILSLGSAATFQYRNQIFNNDDNSMISYTESLDNLFRNNIGHQLSIRINYFIDYNRLKRKN